jgi:hypothetical protein
MPSFEELLKTPEGIEEAEAYLQSLKVDSEMTIRLHNMQRLIDEAEKKLTDRRQLNG